MAKINDLDINSMSIQEVAVQLEQLVKKLRKARFSAALGSLENPSVLRDYKRDIARLKTALKCKSA